MTAGPRGARPFNLTGQRYGILTAISLAERPPNGQGAHWLCKCDCGGTKVARAKDLRNGNTASCGCMQRPPGRGIKGPKLAINRPWRPAEKVDDRWLTLVGANVPPGSVP